ncbi:hypothetical protein [Xenorhabdus innexi]|uniref:Uncharacterized protein n=1 Tax=Xenorhabdus innexi TaxID=290109 RepID=A0A1N6MWH2_9GAMM|nr:hypothetical protein [Xenorhabdus innexi]PHM35919.1 hypothetical protein Xinn_01989 [Xenorhabdus innexi]SIP73218.1 hypothetical protein XIS1_1790024 [Xenorhabdus innexi]
MKKMHRHFGELPTVTYTRSPRMSAYLSQHPKSDAEETSPADALIQTMQKTVKDGVLDDTTSTAFQSDQFDGVAQILGG